MADKKMTHSHENQQLQLQSQTQRKSLYVGDLDTRVTSNDLYFVFSQIGQLTNVRVCRDRVSFKSLGYGYVNFVSHYQAAKAMYSLNHKNLKGKPMRIMWSERNPITRKTGTANLFVKNLDTSIDSARLESIFSKFGTILSCKVEEDNNGKSKGFGFIQFDKEKSAMDALDALNDTLLEGKKLYVGKFIKSSLRKLTFTNLYVKTLNNDLTEDDLKEKFSKFGSVKSAAIMRNNLGYSKGFGFVSFNSPQEAKIAMEALNGTLVLGDKNLYVGRAEKKAERTKSIKQEIEKWKASTLYVKNLDRSVDDSLLKSHFKSCGMVILAKVILYENGISKEFGFVTYACPSDAYKALAKLQGSNLQGKPLQIAMARSKEEWRNFILCVKNFTPYYPARNNASNLSLCPPTKQNFRGKEGLNSHTATRNSTVSSQMFFSKETRSSSCINLKVLFEKAQNSGEKISGVELNMKDSDVLKPYANQNSFMELIKEVLQLIVDAKARECRLIDHA